MRQWLAIPWLLGLLSGCTAGPPEPLPPYPLSEAEISAVVRGLYSAVKDLDAPSFRNFKAARSSSGDIYVCGWVRSRFSREQAFIGALSAGRFSPERIGTNEYSTGEVRAKCHELGISII
jgi:hypothetical protein